MMSMSSVKDRKPWYVPTFLWNLVVDVACDEARKRIKVADVASVVSKAALSGLCRAIDGKDDKVVDVICRTIEHGGVVFSKAAAAARDKVVTEDEKAEVGNAILETVNALVPQDAVDAKIEEIRNGLRFD